MKILVGYKRVVDYNVRVQVKPDGSGVVTEGVKLSANPFDDIALEEALRLRDKGIATDVVIATIGPADAQAHIRNGLAMGANRAIHVVTSDAVQPLTAARVLLKLIEKEQPGIVLLGKQAIDDDCNQTGQMLAALMDRPQATFASKVEVNGNAARVTREVDAGLETIEVDLPAVITTDLRQQDRHRRWQGHRHPRGRWRPADAGASPARGRHRRSPSQHPALHRAPQHH